MSGMGLGRTSTRQREFLGRAQLVDQTVSCLGRQGANVLLVGAGGVGKTSLAGHSIEVLGSREPGLLPVHFTATEATQRTPLAVFSSVLSEDSQPGARPTVRPTTAVAT